MTKAQTNKPRVAITGPQKGSRAPRWCVAAVIRWYGGIPLQVRPEDDLSAVEYDAIVVTGGHDIDPVLYAAEPEVHPKYDQQRDKFEAQLIDDAIARDLPLLSICRGAQLLNVRCGGNLFQDLSPQRKRTSKRRSVLPLKNLYNEQNSLVAQVMGCTHCKINSLHNQAVDQLGEGLRVVGRDQDDIVQAIEAPAARFRIGVQWHPEFLIFMRRHRALFKALLRATETC